MHARDELTERLRSSYLFQNGREQKAWVTHGFTNVATDFTVCKPPTSLRFSGMTHLRLLWPSLLQMQSI